MADLKKRIALVAAVLVIGSLATAYTHYFVTTNEYTAASESFEEETAVYFEAPAEAGGGEPAVAAARAAVPQEAEGTGETYGESAAALPDAAAADGVTPEALSAEEPVEEELSQEASWTEETLEGADTIEAAAEEESAETFYAMYQRRLDDLEEQILKTRSQQTKSTAISIKEMADTELELWDKELNSLYETIMEQLDEAGRKELARKEREWMKERDAAAEKAAPVKSGGSIESAEYTASLAESTKARAYELLEEYQDYLKKPAV